LTRAENHRVPVFNPRHGFRRQAAARNAHHDLAALGVIPLLDERRMNPPFDALRRISRHVQPGRTLRVTPFHHRQHHAEPETHRLLRGATGSHANASTGAVCHAEFGRRRAEHQEDPTRHWHHAGTPSRWSMATMPSGFSVVEGKYDLAILKGTTADFGVTFECRARQKIELRRDDVPDRIPPEPSKNPIFREYSRPKKDGGP
jgi:hypothetical protein